MSFTKTIKNLALASLCALGAAGAQADIINGGFENPASGGALTGWTDTDSVYGSNRCSFSSCNNVAGAASGDYWIWFGGNALDQVAQVSQTATIENTASLLAFDLYAAGISGTGKLTVSVDSTILFTMDEVDALAYSTGYFTISVPLGALADGNSHVVSFDYVDGLDTTTFGTSYFLDNVRLIQNATVPEPGSLALVGLATLALAATRRRSAR